MKIEKLTPAFKDYLWGRYEAARCVRQNCDYEKVAESWEL